MKKQQFLKKYINIFACLIFFGIFLALRVFKIDILEYFKPAVCQHCNVILVTIDTLGSSHLPCYGYKINTAPNLCNFAQKNILFANSYSNATWTFPSQISIFTSLYPKHHNIGNFDDNNNLGTNIITLPQILKAHGYDTVYVAPTDMSKILGMNRGIQQGFQEIINNESTSTWEEGYKKLLDNEKKGKSTFLFLYTDRLHSPYGNGFPQNPKDKHLFTDKYYPQIPITYDQINEFSLGFYNYLLAQYKNIVDSNYQYESKEEIKIYTLIKNADNFARAKEIFNKSISGLQQSQYYNDYYLSRIGKDKNIVNYIRALYDEAIYYADKNLLELFTILSDKKLSKDTIVIITSQHGEEFMENGHLQHQEDNISDAVTSVPLIMYIPGVKQRKIKEMVQSIDIFPKILNLVGIRKPSTTEGIDLTNIILNKSDKKTNPFTIVNGPNVDSIRNEKWKLQISYIPSANNKIELYDLENDPKEQNNVAIRYPEVVHNLSKSLESIIYKRDIL